MEVDIGANPSAEEEEEGVDSTARKVVDVVDAFRLNVSNWNSICSATFMHNSWRISLGSWHVR